jgi:hypothetical protein
MDNEVSMLHVNALELIEFKKFMFLFSHDSIFAHPTFSSSTNNFARAQTLSRIRSLLGHMNIVRVNIEFFTGCKKIKQRRISFVPGYLRMIL